MLLRQVLKENEKAARLEQELGLVTEKRAIVFVNTKRQCDNVFSVLENQGYRRVRGGGQWVGAARQDKNLCRAWQRVGLQVQAPVRRRVIAG